MFYSTQILAKKGPLGLVWLAAHMDNRLKKNNVFEANISGSVDSILNPEAPLALRLSGQLLLGVVNIYKRKLVYLFEDCTDAISKMQQAFKPVTLTLPGDGKAAATQITLPDEFDVGHLQSLFEEVEDDYGPIDMSQGLQLHLNTKDSLYLAEDATQLFRTPSSYRDEEFEIAGDEIEEHLSMEPPERLREAVAPTAKPLFETAIASPSFRGNEVLPDVDMDGMDILDAPPSAAPSSARPSDIGFDDTISPLDFGGDPMPDVLPAPELEEDSVWEQKGTDIPKPARQMRKGGQKRQKVVRDVDTEGNPATVISTATLRKLQGNRDSLMRETQLLSKLQIAASVPHSRPIVGTQAKGKAGPSWMTQPGLSSDLDSKLYDLYSFGQSDLVTSKNAGSSQRDKQDAATAGNGQDEEAPFSPARADAMHGDDAHDGAFEPPELDHGGGDTPYNEAFAMDFNDNLDPAAVSPPGSRPLSSGRNDTHSPVNVPPSVGKDSSVRKRRASRADDADDAMEEEEYDYNAKDSFTARSQQVLRQIKGKLSGKTGAKVQKLSGQAAQGVSLKELQGSGDRTEAARLFFELLVLQARKQVTLSQSEPYSEISVSI